MNNPAPTSKSSDSATCATTSPLRNTTAVPPTTFEAWSFSVGASSGRVACKAGARPKNTPVNTDTSAVKPSTVASGVPESVIGVVPTGRNEIRALSINTARPRPAMPPMPESSTLSTSSWRINCARPAPSASRSAISFCREDARAINRFARFEHAISSTSATIAINASRGFENCSRNCERPFDAGSVSIHILRNSDFE